MRKYTSLYDAARDVAKHFLIAAIWADCEEGTHPRETAQARRVAQDVCYRFLCRYPRLFARARARFDNGYGAHPDCGDEGAAGAFGHDLWLTLRGHGAGFWDRDALEADRLGEELTRACKEFGHVEFEQYRGWAYLYARAN